MLIKFDIILFIYIRKINKIISMDLEIDTYSSILVDNTPENIKKMSTKILENQSIIFPNETIYEIGCNGLDDNAIENLYKIKHKKSESKYPISLNCLGFYDTITLVELDEMDTKLLKNIIENLWPGPLTIMLKANDEIIPKQLIDKDGFTCFQSPNHPIIRKIIQYSSIPIASSGANINEKIKSTCIEHVLDHFGDIPIHILNDNNYISTYGYETTLIKIYNHKVYILREGPIQNLKDYIKNNSICYNLVNKHKIKFKQDVYVLDILDIELDLSQVNQSIIDEYLDNAFLIDFNKLSNRYKNKFLGYVDLSINGDSNEALFNLYNVLHQINNINCEKILIYNFSFIDNKYNKILWNILSSIITNHIAIPLIFL